MPASRLGHTPLGHGQCRFPRGHKAGLSDVAALVPQDNELASEINARWWKPPISTSPTGNGVPHVSTRATIAKLGPD